MVVLAVGHMHLCSYRLFKNLRNGSNVLFDQRGSGKSEYNLRNGLTIEQITTDVFAVVEVIKTMGYRKTVVLWVDRFEVIWPAYV